MAALAQAVAGLRHPASAAPGPTGLHPDGLPVLIWKHEVQNFVTINTNNVISLTALQSDYNIYNSTNHLLACRVLLDVRAVEDAAIDGDGQHHYQH